MRPPRTIQEARRRAAGWKPAPRRLRRAGHTLVELAVSTVALGILLAGMGSAILVASRAARPGTAPANAVRAASAADEMAADLRMALSFSQRTATAVQFTVADRNGDGDPETLRYAWSGTAGDPLTRQLNAGAAATVCENLHALQLGYSVLTVTDPQAGTKHYLNHVSIALQVGADSNARVIAGVQVLNGPEVASP